MRYDQRNTGGSSTWVRTHWQATRAHSETSIALNLNTTATPTFIVRERRQTTIPDALDWPIQQSEGEVGDLKEQLMNDPEALALLYKEAAEEDCLLGQIGLTHYAQVLRREETSA